MNRLKNKTCFLFDLDGTIYLSEHLIPGATDLLAEIRRQGKHFAFMTNNSSSAKKQYLEKMKRLGIEDCKRNFDFHGCYFTIFKNAEYEKNRFVSNSGGGKRISRRRVHYY